jgi:hypothetical protein
MEEEKKGTQIKWGKRRNYETLDFHLGKNEHDSCLLGCCAVLTGRMFPTFQRCLLSPSSWRSKKTTIVFKRESGYLSPNDALTTDGVMILARSG